MRKIKKNSGFIGNSINMIVCYNDDTRWGDYEIKGQIEKVLKEYNRIKEIDPDMSIQYIATNSARVALLLLAENLLPDTIGHLDIRYDTIPDEIKLYYKLKD